MKKTQAGSGKEQIKREDVKQAVVVDYKAIGCRSPGGSANSKPLIQYSLEWLLIEKFDEVFVCCLPDNAQKMRELVKHFLRTENVPESMTIQVHSSEKNESTGDCLRDLDAKALIKNDFVIMDVGCCGNLPLTELLEAHKKLKKIDNNVILTSVVRNLFTKNPAEIGEFPIYVIDPRTGLLLHYVAGRISSNELHRPSSVKIPSKVFLNRAFVKIYTNLCSTNLSIYSANVPLLYNSSEFLDACSEADLIQAAFGAFDKTAYIHLVDDLFSQRMADLGFVINQKWDQFDTNLIYQRNERCQVVRKLVNDSLIDCTRLNSEDYIANIVRDDDSNSNSSNEAEEPFLDEVLDSLKRCCMGTISTEDLIKEVNISKHFELDIEITDVHATLAEALLLLPYKLTDDKLNSRQEYWSHITKCIENLTEFLQNYFNNDESRKTLMTTLEKLYFSKRFEYLNDPVLAETFWKLYEIDALDEDTIINWFDDFEEEFEMPKNNREDLRNGSSFKDLLKVIEAESEEE